MDKLKMETPNLVVFNDLIKYIKQTNNYLQAINAKSINISLTTRNWLIGFYIKEYEMNGADKAKYGEHLFTEISQKLKNIPRCEKRELNRYVEFYTSYKQIGETVSPQLKLNLQLTDYQRNIIGETLSPQLKILEESKTNPRQVSGDILLKKLSFSHFCELLTIKEPLKRLFYEVECIKGTWSVRELKRQINSLYFERSGLSKDKNKLAELANFDAQIDNPKLTIKDDYIFEFLGLNSKYVMSESKLEDALLDKIQDFLFELGNGFCLEARQKRIIIDEEYYYADLVFYHRILKCHIIIELKNEAFNHNNIGQLNAYVSYYKENMMTTHDNPPIGILLCTKNKQTLAKYALAGLDEQLFVSQYKLELPEKSKLEKLIDENLEILENKNT